MRHLKSGNKLSRETSHRRAMLLNLCKSLIEHGRIETTIAKAKELRMWVEPIVTLGKEDTIPTMALSPSSSWSWGRASRLVRVATPAR
jgi:large subunit ribosomal protein L17